MTTSFGSKSFRHIVDVDGQLHGMEAASVCVATLLALAGRGASDRLFRIERGVATPLDLRSSVTLSEEEVAFFESDRPILLADARLAA